jgi:hypothetical protein
MSFDHSRHRAHLLRQSVVAAGLRGRAARAEAADSHARRALGDRYMENTVETVTRAA